MTQFKIQFEKITATTKQIDVLYDLLIERPHNISHVDSEYTEHKKFVFSHPYRIWFLVKIKNDYVGSFYISQENTIGINISERYVNTVLTPIIKFVMSNYQPFTPIPSVRGERFTINVPQTNKVLVESLESIGAKPVQVTYNLPSKDVKF